MLVAVPQPEAGAADREGGLEEVLDFSIKAKDVKKVGIAGDLMNPLKVREAAPRAAPARTGYPDRMRSSSPKHVVLVLHQFINSLHKGTEPAPAPPHRDPGGGGRAASHHLAAEPEQVPQRPHLMLPQV